MSQLLDDLLAGMPTRLEPFDLPQAEVDEAVERLASPWTAESLALDPYWPKWDSPWWTMALLYEMGLASLIPPAAAEALADALDRHYLHEFPLEGADPMRVLCHCGLGTVYGVLSAAGVDVDERLPWIRPWFLRYQLPDGGLNCDEGAYLRTPAHSSMVSTLPPLEAVLRHASPLSAEEEGFLSRGAAYLLARRLHVSSSTGQVINSDWLIPTFPRFYEYDVLRGLQFVTRWAAEREQELAASRIREAVRGVAESLGPGGQLRLARSFALEETTRFWMNGQWHDGFPATTFPLLEALSRAGEPSPYLTRAWLEVADNLRRLDQLGKLVPDPSANG